MKKVIVNLMGLLVPVLLFGAAVAGGWFLLRTGPQVERNTDGRPAPIVEALPVVRGDFHRVAEAFGPVIPSKDVTIHPEVSGRIVEMHPELQPGGIIREGELLVRIDASDYEIALAQAKNAVAEAQADYEVERGRRMVAEREWELFGKDLPDAEKAQGLALREPQLRQAEARIATAKSAVELAELNLSRTEIRAPFDALVMEEDAEIGQQASPGTAIAQLAGTGTFWVQAALPVARLGAVLEASDTADAVLLHPETPGATTAPAEGKLVRALGSVDPEGRMAQILVEVADPLRLGAEPDADHPPLILDTYVRAELDAGTLQDVVTLQRKALRENREVWVVEAGDTLRVREITIVWQQGETVAVLDVFEPEDRVVVSPVSDLSPGMTVRVLGDDTAPENVPAS